MTTETSADLVRALLSLLPVDLEKEVIKNTPHRVVRAFVEMTGGYQLDPSEILSTQFDADDDGSREPGDDMVVLAGVRWSSLCRHHLLPFSGKAWIGYMPDQQLVGLSKLARLVDCHARRLQLQEHLARDIAEDLTRHLKPLGVAVILKAQHSCLAHRGARQPDADMVTTVTTGAIRACPDLREQFLALANLRG